MLVRLIKNSTVGVIGSYRNEPQYHPTVVKHRPDNPDKLTDVKSRVGLAFAELRRIVHGKVTAKKGIHLFPSMVSMEYTASSSAFRHHVRSNAGCKQEEGCGNMVMIGMNARLCCVALRGEAMDIDASLWTENLGLFIEPSSAEERPRALREWKDGRVKCFPTQNHPSTVSFSPNILKRYVVSLWPGDSRTLPTFQYFAALIPSLIVINPNSRIHCSFEILGSVF
jgi:hypothetical protein